MGILDIQKKIRERGDVSDQKRCLIVKDEAGLEEVLDRMERSREWRDEMREKFLPRKMEGE